MKRFYKQVTVGSPTGPQGNDHEFPVLLDGRSAKTPGMAALALPTRALAEAIAGEWAQQGDEIMLQEMSLTRLACNALDRLAFEETVDGLIDELVGFGGSDLLCYRADTPQSLVQRQQKAWQPYLDWFADHCGAELSVTTGVVHVAQPADSLNALRAVVSGFGPLYLAALQSAVAILGSLVLALAVAEKFVDGEAAWVASRLDEDFQIELWGQDSEAADSAAALKVEFMAAAEFMALCPFDR